MAKANSDRSKEVKRNILLSGSVCAPNSWLFLSIPICDEVSESLTERVQREEQTARQKNMYCEFVSEPVNDICSLKLVC